MMKRKRKKMTSKMKVKVKVRQRKKIKRRRKRIKEILELIQENKTIRDSDCLEVGSQVHGNKLIHQLFL